MNPVWITLMLAASAAAQATAPPGDSFENLVDRARQAREAARDDEAISLYSRALKLKPGWADGWWALGGLQYHRDRYPECRDALAELTRLDPEAAAGWALRGLCEFRTRQYDLARDHLKRAHTLTTGGGELRKIADYHLALLLIREGAFELSFELLVKVARMAKNDPE
ncbi:MAG TPA: tetratricopeptide repeat protein, partial [Bryobacteraceae bacterium]|nr:tetratricopeptide repeat protein [Bryobacteraceae bacterium]